MHAQQVEFHFLHFLWYFENLIACMMNPSDERSMPLNYSNKEAKDTINNTFDYDRLYLSSTLIAFHKIMYWW